MDMVRFCLFGDIHDASNLLHFYEAIMGFRK